MADGIQIAIGHDAYTTVTQIYNSVSGTSGGTAVIGATGRNGTNGIRLTLGGGSQPSIRVAKTLPATLGTIRHAFPFRTNALPVAADNRLISELRDAGTTQCLMRMLSDGTIQICRGSFASPTVLGTSTDFSLLINVLYHFEWEILIHPSAGTIKFWVNEVLKLEVPVAITRTSANSWVSEFTLANATNSNAGQIGAYNDFDDVIVRNDQQIGDKNVREDLPTGTGATDQWTADGAASTRECVDDNPPNEDTDFAKTTTPGHISLWTYPTIPTTSAVDALIGMPRAKKTDAGTATICSVFRDAAGPSNHDGDTKAPSQDSYEYHPNVWMENPATAAPFTAAEINNGQLGIKRVA